MTAPTLRDNKGDWRTGEEWAASAAQARNLKGQAQAAGLRFEVFLPSGLAEWLLGLIEAGTFFDPQEALFVMLKEYKDLLAYPDMRRELLARTLQAAIDDPRPSLSTEEVFEKLHRRVSEARQEPAVWQKMPINSVG